MMTEDQVGDIIKAIADDVPGFIAAALVDTESGMTLGLYSQRPDFDLAAASAYNSELVKQKVKIMEAIGLKSELEDIVMTLNDQLHMLKLIGDGSFLYLAADRSTANLAMVRRAVQKHQVALAT